ncbi:MAG: hypothetical protein ACODAE_04705 [Gemmatimonadota bacterium]
MSEGGRGPGPILTWVAERLVPESVRDGFVGDLIEQAAGYGPIGGRLWFALQLFVSLPALVQLRFRRPDGGRRRGALLWGLVFAVVWISGDVLRRPWIWVVALLVGAWLNAAAAVLIYRRTPFALFAFAAAVSSVELLAGAAVFLLYPPDVVLSHPVFLAAAAVTIVGMFVVWFWSRRAHPEAWRRWRAAADETGMIGYLLFEHVPRLRSNR